MQLRGEYNTEQLQTINAILSCLNDLCSPEREALEDKITSYLAFRREVDRFLAKHFSGLCTHRCYHSGESACCSREGITTFFADVVVNLLVSPRKAIESLVSALSETGNEKCVYLSSEGCLWQVKPIVCEMFLCRHARDTVFGKRPDLLEAWRELRQREKRFTWPTRPVLFDELETFFMERGCHSSLMYFHNSPGLLRVKETHNVP